MLCYVFISYCYVMPQDTTQKSVDTDTISFKEAKLTSDEYYSQTLEFGAIEAQMSFFQGKILTIIDASFSDVEQREAVKDLIKSEFKDKIRHFGRLCSGATSEGTTS